MGKGDGWVHHVERRRDAQERVIAGSRGKWKGDGWTKRAERDQSTLSQSTPGLKLLSS